MNKKILFLFSTHEGQTEKIIDYIIANFSVQQFDMVKMNIEQVIPANIESFSGVVIASSIRYGQYHPKIIRYVRQHLHQLQRIPSSFIGVNLVARKEGKNTIATNSYTYKFLKKVNWQPKLVTVFAGAVYYSRYSWINRRLIQLIMKITGGETDTTKNIEYTNWSEVKKYSALLSDYFDKVR